jgi:membrane-bound lytic murein transglycosylase D
VTVTTSHDIDVDVAAKLANMGTDEFRALNPSFKKPVIVGATQPQILLPFDNASAFEHNLKAYTGQLSSWTTYTVTKRASPQALAEKIGVDAQTLMSVNKIPAGMRLKPGSTLVVPRGDDDDEDISADVAEGAVLAMEPDVPDTRKMLIRVRRKQSMAAIASRYGVSLHQLRAWNRTHRREAMPGQVIVLHVPVGRDVPAEPRAQKIATAIPRGARVERIDARADDVKPKSHGRHVSAKGRTHVTRTAAHAATKSAHSSATSSKSTAKSSKTAGGHERGKSKGKS